MTPAGVDDRRLTATAAVRHTIARRGLFVRGPGGERRSNTEPSCATRCRGTAGTLTTHAHRGDDTNIGPK
jgi:hypothetical protein